MTLIDFKACIGRIMGVNALGGGLVVAPEGWGRGTAP